MDQTGQNAFTMNLIPQASSKATLVTLAGRLDTNSVGRFKAALTELAEQGKVFFVIDFSQLRFLDSSGLGALVSLLRLLGQKKGDIKLACLSPEVKSLFMLTRLNKVFDIFESVQSALAAFD
ncbi:STAS domain-containing protein [Fundidesulfovibrio butyratiphilus]